MSARLANFALVAMLVVLAAWVWGSSATLPEVVASHFALDGAANGFMPRPAYTALMLALVFVLPAFLAFVPGATLGQGGTNLSIPHRDYWLAPERRERTIAFIRVHGRRLAVVVAVFLAYVNWLVVQANRLQPPQLSVTGLGAGLAAFFVLLSVWIIVLMARFRRRA